MHLRFAVLSSFLGLTLLTPLASGGDTPHADGSPRIDSYGDPLPPGAVYRIGTTRLRHEMSSDSSFGNVLLSPDGKLVLSSGGGDDAIRVWETATGREIRQFPASRITRHFALAANGSLVAISDGSEIHLYDTATGKKQRTLDSSPLGGANAYQYSLNFSQDGKILTVFHFEGERGTNYIRRWESATGRNIENWKMGVDEPLALSADGKLVASLEEREDSRQAKNTKEDTIRLWEMATRKKIQEWKTVGRVPRRFRCLIFSPDRRHILTAGEDAMIRVYETATGKELQSWKGRTPKQHADELDQVDVGWLTFAPDGKSLASVDRTCVCCLWDWKTGRELRRFDKVAGPVAFSADGKILAARGVDYRVRLWDTATGHDLCPFRDPDGISHVALSPDGHTLAAGTDRPTIHLRNTTSGQLLKSYPGYHLVSFSPDGTSLLVRRRDDSLCLLDANTGEERIRFRGTQKDCDFRGWNAEKKLLLTSSDLSIVAWDITTGKIRCEIRGQWQSEKMGVGLHCSPDGRTVAVSDHKSSRIRLFATDTGKELHQLTGYSLTVDCVYHQKNGECVSPETFHFPIYSGDGKSILAACDRKSFALWDVASGKRTFQWNCAEFLPIWASSSPDGKWLLLHDTYCNLCLMDPVTGRVRHRLTRKEEDPNQSLEPSKRALTEDDRLLAVTCDPHTIVLWEVATGRPIRTWPGHDRGEVLQMVFSADNRRLVTAGSDGTALVWDVMGLSPDGQLPNRNLTSEETKQAWNDLSEADAAKGHRAIWSLIADPARALPLLRERLRPVSGVDPRRITHLIADLDSDDFTVREMSTRELRTLCELAEPALRAALKDKPSLELRRRGQGLLEEIGNAIPSAESLRNLRAVAVLEYIANDEARQLLDALARGVAEARLTREAKESLARLCSRRVQP
jgi:WD40 repeat protein